MTEPGIAMQKFFRDHLMLWHKRDNHRQMPWKGEKDVYKIWLSEIILQQTRVEQGTGYYLRFIEAYPTVNHLAAAPQEEVYKLWEGLGYYNRCKNLHHTAQAVVHEMGGKFPVSYEGLLQLKGIGPYTAAAIASFAYNLPHAVVDGNVYRVLSRFFGISVATDSSAGQKLFRELAEACLHRQKPALYNQAIMDLGATVCKPETPLCDACPLQRKCRAYDLSMVSDLPVREKQVKQKDRWFVFFALQSKGKMAVRKREGKDIWHQLFELPHFEAGSKKDWQQFIRQGIGDWVKAHYASQFSIESVSPMLRQPLTHQQIHAVFVRAELKRPLAHLQQHWQWPDAEELEQIAFPKIINRFLKET